MSIATAAGLIMAGITLFYAIFGPRPCIKPTADALLDLTDFLSVSVQAGRSSVTILAVNPVVFFDPVGRDPGQTQLILSTSRVAPSGSISLDAKQTETIGIALTMQPQLLPGPHGSPQEMRSPRREEIRVRIDYGRKKSLFVQPALVDFVVEHNDDK